MSSSYERVKINGVRHYHVPGADAPYPSVTTITDTYPPKKKAVAAASVTDDELERLGTLGTIAHHRILKQYAIRDLPKPYINMGHLDAEMKADIETCVKMWNDLGFDPGDSPWIEERVHRHDPGYAGTFDMLTGSGTVVDLKTSKGIYDSHKLQISAYFHAIESLDDYPDPADAAIIKIHPNPEYNARLEAHIERIGETKLRELFDTFCELAHNYSP